MATLSSRDDVKSRGTQGQSINRNTRPRDAWPGMKSTRSVFERDLARERGERPSGFCWEA